MDMTKVEVNYVTWGRDLQDGPLGLWSYSCKVRSYQASKRSFLFLSMRLL